MRLFSPKRFQRFDDDIASIRTRAPDAERKNNEEEPAEDGFRPKAKLQTFEPEIRHDICTWWNESRKSKHGAKATWTERAFLGSVYRMAALPSWKQMVLVKAGIEHGWQTRQEEYVKDILDKHKPYRPGLQPKSSAMQKALEQWNPS